MAKEKIEQVEWQAPEYEFYAKSNDWFWSLGVITAALFIGTLLLNNILFAVLILMAGFSLALYAFRRSRVINFSIGPKGVQIEKNIYPYENLKSFWINYDPPYKKELILESKKVIIPQIVIMLGDVDPEKIREILLNFLKEEKREESLIDGIFKLLRF